MNADDGMSNAEIIRAMKRKKVELAEQSEPNSPILQDKLPRKPKKKKVAASLASTQHKSLGIGDSSGHGEDKGFADLAQAKEKSLMMEVGDLPPRSPLPQLEKNDYRPEVSLLKDTLGLVALGLIQHLVSDADLRTVWQESE